MAPEFLNRVDKTIVFKPLTHESLVKIVELLLKDLQERLSEKSITITMTKAAYEKIIKDGFDVLYGARPLRRVMQDYIEDEIAEKLLSREINEGDALVVDVKGNAFVIKKKGKGKKEKA
jgi:ATP-dependent Clp protease ATP-binding subunit ClpA